MALIFEKNAADKALILGIRETLIYPFTSPAWTDIRLGLFLSATRPDTPDVTTGLAETLTQTAPLDRVYVGFKDNSNTSPLIAGGSFMGYMTPPGTTTQLVAQTPTYYRSPVRAAMTLNSSDHPGLYLDVANGINPLDNTFPGAYASQALIRVVKDVGPQLWRVYVAAEAESHNTATPTVGELRAQLRNQVTWNQISVTISPAVIEPAAIYVHWPFFNSRLRIHAIVLEKYA